MGGSRGPFQKIKHTIKRDIPAVYIFIEPSLECSRTDIRTPRGGWGLGGRFHSVSHALVLGVFDIPLHTRLGGLILKHKYLGPGRVGGFYESRRGVQ